MSASPKYLHDQSTLYADPPKRVAAYMSEVRGPNQAGRASVLAGAKSKLAGPGGKSSSKLGSPLDGKYATYTGPTSSRTQILDGETKKT